MWQVFVKNKDDSETFEPMNYADALVVYTHIVAKYPEARVVIRKAVE